jgi:uncharacterized membrane protein YdbT with pleckstrin-like domain
MSAPGTAVIKIKPSLLPFTWKGFVLVLLGLVFYVGVLALPFRSPISSLFLDYATLGLIGLGFLGILIGTVRRNAFTYIITSSDIVVQKQLISRSVRRIPFSSISDVEVSQSLIGRLVGYGNIAPVTKSGYGLVRGSDPAENKVAEMTYVPKPDEVAALIISRASITTRLPDKT